MKRLFTTLLATLACSGAENPSPDQTALFRRDRTLAAHTAVARELSFSPDGLTLATSSVDSTVKIWNLQHGWLLRTIRHPTAVAAIAYSPDGKWLVSGGYDGGVRVWSLADGALIKAIPGHTLNVWAVDFSSDGKYLASGSFDESVRLWDPNTGAPIRTLAGHEQAVVGIDFSPNGKVLATSGDDNTIRLWNVETGRLIRRIDTGNHTCKIAFSPNGELLVSGGRARSALGTLWHQLTAGQLGNAPWGATEALEGRRRSPGANSGGGEQRRPVGRDESRRQADRQRVGGANDQDLAVTVASFGLGW